MAARKSKAEGECKLICCKTPPAALERIRADVARWEPGAWARENNYGPACTCGLRGKPKEACDRHGTDPDHG